MQGLKLAWRTIARNRLRDQAAREREAMRGWRVETVWECELKDDRALEARIADWLNGN